jgi:hypothetical protein
MAQTYVYLAGIGEPVVTSDTQRHVAELAESGHDFVYLDLANPEDGQVAVLRSSIIAIGPTQETSA